MKSPFVFYMYIFFWVCPMCHVLWICVHVIVVVVDCVCVYYSMCGVCSVCICVLRFSENINVRIYLRHYWRLNYKGVKILIFFPLRWCVHKRGNISGGWLFATSPIFVCCFLFLFSTLLFVTSLILRLSVFLFQSLSFILIPFHMKKRKNIRVFNIRQGSRSKPWG